MKFKPILIAAILLLPVGSAHSDTVYCVNCSNEVMEMARQAQNFAQYAQQTSNIIAQLEVMRAQAERLTTATPFSQTSSLLNNLMQIVNQGQALGYDISNITRRFESQYPGFKVNGSYYDNYKNWSQTTSDSLRAALMAAGMQMNNFATESATADTLRTMNQSPAGQLQAIQIGNAVSSEMLDEMRKLRQINTAQMQAQNAYMLGQQQKLDTEQAQSKQFLDQVPLNPKLIKNMK
ncbi:P-type conjugative transfer protein TrbJ [Methylophilus rhizosphaerae]|uniref:P-type conjugative transfer protein TrbJ n=1 Tax=Methylophilus rhizosphaerae TaxID=492660 RepID=A0A1G9CMX0_9PROT|nr:P-type conjugative transfer protein TrbJ [Methylophilus rhizosphaerae]SDK52804.1 P-type conjugative transfer protein TrbJ [Methylophilus rhizosphaerae]